MAKFFGGLRIFSEHADYRISFVGGLLLAGLTLAEGVAVYSLLETQREFALNRNLISTLKENVQFFESQIEEGLTDSYAVATLPFLVQTLQKVNEDNDNVNALRELGQKIDSSGLTAVDTAVTVYDINGKELLQRGRNVQNYADKFPLDAHSNSFLTWDDNQFILHVEQDLLDQNQRRIGSITTERNLTRLASFFREIKKIGESAELMLCKQPKADELEIVCLQSNANYVEFKRLPREIMGTSSPISFALEGRSGVMTTEAYRHVPVIATYSPVGTFGMLLMQSKEELYSQAIERIKVITLVQVLLIFIGILLLIWLLLPLMRRLAYSEKKARERLKECQCLHGIRRDMEHNLHEDEFCQKVITRLIQAMQFPDITSVMIKLGDKQFISDGYEKDSAHKLQSQILVNGKVYGSLNVIYSENRPFWLPEEQDLIDTVASVLGKWTQQEQARQRIIRMATHDGLTGLPNRYLLEDRIKQVLAHDRRTHEQAAVLFVDLDCFKEINDKLGHAMGDLLLRDVATRLNAIIRTEDTVARHGGDEFIILLQNIPNRQEVKIVAEKILHALTQPFDLDGKELHIGGSIGIALFPYDGNDVQTLLKNSDMAMYHAKQNGRNNYQFFSQEMNQETATEFITRFQNS